MSLILDTSILIELERKNKKFLDKLEELKNDYPSPPRLSFISYFEFIYGLRKKSIKNKQKSEAFVNFFDLLHTTKNTAKILANLKEKYELPLADLFIAAQVIETNSVLLTKDDDFDQIQELDKIILSFDVKESKEEQKGG